MPAVETKAAEHPEQLINAVESALRAHDLRLKPGSTIDSIVGDLRKAGLTLQVEYGSLTGKVGDQVANVPQCIENFAKQNGAKFFPRDVSTGITAKDQLDPRGASEFIKTHGLPAYETLPLKTQAPQPVELNPRTLTATQWRSLPTKTKVELCNTWTREQIAAIQTRKR